MLDMRRFLLGTALASICGWAQASSTVGNESCAAGEEVTYAFNPATNVCSVFLNPCQVPTGWRLTTAQSCVMDHDFQITPSGLPSGGMSSGGGMSAGSTGQATGGTASGNPVGGTPSGPVPTGNAAPSGTTGLPSGDAHAMPMPDYSALVATTVSAMSQWTSQLLNNLFAGMNGGSIASGSLYFPASGVLAIKCLRVSGVEDKVVDATLKQLPPTAGSSAILFSVVEMTTADPASCGTAAPASSSGDPFLELINRTQP